MDVHHFVIPFSIWYFSNWQNVFFVQQSMTRNGFTHGPGSFGLFRSDWASWRKVTYSYFLFPLFFFRRPITVTSAPFGRPLFRILGGIFIWEKSGDLMPFLSSPYVTTESSFKISSLFSFWLLTSFTGSSSASSSLSWVIPVGLY